jgi:ABC-type nitrate/sulfonate/bicarbonate transport system ATPase subunit
MVPQGRERDGRRFVGAGGEPGALSGPAPVPVLILDEPTTGLAAPTARRVLAPLRRLMAGRTTILITHDLHLAPEADRIVVLDGRPPTGSGPAVPREIARRYGRTPEAASRG